MDQQGQYIILCSESLHIILEAARIDPDMAAAKHLYNIRPQSAKIHVHIYLQRVIGLRGSPVIGKPVTPHRLRYGFRIINMLEPYQFVSVIPALCLSKVHGKPLTQFFHLVLRKAGILFEYILICHGIFRKHIQRGMRTIFFDRQNPRHIGQCHIGLVFQKIPQKIKILPLQPLRFLLLTHHTVPFIDQKDKLPVCFHINLFQYNG